MRPQPHANMIFLAFSLLCYCDIFVCLLLCEIKARQQQQQQRQQHHQFNNMQAALATNRWQKCARYKFMLETSNRRKLRAAWPGLAWPELQAGGALAVKFLTCLDLQFSNSNSNSCSRSSSSDNGKRCRRLSRSTDSSNTLIRAYLTRPWQQQQQQQQH